MQAWVGIPRKTEFPLVYKKLQTYNSPTSRLELWVDCDCEFLPMECSCANNKRQLECNV